MNNPERPEDGTRQIPFTGELYIEQDDFMEDPPKKYFRLAPGKEVRLRWGYFIKCEEVVKDADGNVVELKCTYDPETRGGQAPDGRKVKGTIHWVSAEHAVDAEVRLFPEPLLVKDPETGDAEFNPKSEEILTGCKVEPSLASAEPGYRCQFERLGYFCCDKDSTPEKRVFNSTVTLKDTWAKEQKKN